MKTRDGSRWQDCSRTLWHVRRSVVDSRVEVSDSIGHCGRGARRRAGGPEAKSQRLTVRVGARGDASRDRGSKTMAETMTRTLINPARESAVAPRELNIQGLLNAQG